MKDVKQRFVEEANGMKSAKFDGIAISDYLFEEKASYSMTFKVLYEIGFTLKEIEIIMSSSDCWKNHRLDPNDLFFDFVELDDDLID